MKKFAFLALTVFLGVITVQAHDHKKMPRKMLESIDTDKDKKISKQEWQAFHDKRFAEIDKDGDGFLTKDEFKAQRKAMKKKHKKGKKDHDDHDDND